MVEYVILVLALVAFFCTLIGFGAFIYGAWGILRRTNETRADRIRRELFDYE